MKKAAIYTRIGKASQFSHDTKRDELLAKFGDTHEICAEYRDDSSDSQRIENRPGLKKLLEDAANGNFDVLLCTDLTQLTCADDDDDFDLDDNLITAVRQSGLYVDTIKMKPVNVKFYRVHKDRMVVVELIVTLDAEDEEDAVEKAMEEIRHVLPHDDLFSEGWRWENETVEWLD